MYITLQIADQTFQQMVAGGRRVEGSLGLISPTEGNFNAWQRAAQPEPREFRRLKHGRITRQGNGDVRLSLTFAHDETIDYPYSSISDELSEAKDIILRHLEPVRV